MTKRNPKRRGLKRLRRKAVEVDFNGGRLTSDGGLLLLREVDRRLNDAFPIRKPSRLKSYLQTA